MAWCLEPELLATSGRKGLQGDAREWLLEAARFAAKHPPQHAPPFLYNGGTGAWVVGLWVWRLR